MKTKKTKTKPMSNRAARDAFWDARERPQCDIEEYYWRLKTVLDYFGVDSIHEVTEDHKSHDFHLEDYSNYTQEHWDFIDRMQDGLGLTEEEREADDDFAAEEAFNEHEQALECLEFLLKQQLELEQYNKLIIK
jgi:hypothetical protein